MRILDVPINFERFLQKKDTFILERCCIIFYSKYFRSLATTFSHFSGNKRIPR